MAKINCNIDELNRFAEALEGNRPINCSRDGKWYVENRIIYHVRKLFGYDHCRLQNIAKICAKQLECFERQSCQFGGDTKLVESQKAQAEAHLRVAGAADKIFSKSKKMCSKQSELRHRMVGLKYRVEKVHGGLDKQGVDKVLHQQIADEMAAWKQKQKQYVNKELNERDWLKVYEICEYQEFAQLVMKDKKLQKELFDWAIRDNNQVEIFVEFPDVSKRIKKCLLAGRTGRFAGQILSMKKKQCEETVKKDVRLRFQIENEDLSLKSKKISILDESHEIRLRGEYRITVKRALEIFANKNLEVGNLEVFGGDRRVAKQDIGILNFNPHKLGHFSGRAGVYRSVDVSEPNWWEQLPVFEIIEKGELEKRTGFQLDDSDMPQWIGMAKSTYKNVDFMDVDVSHGFIGVAKKQSDGRYRIYDFGKFPEKFPSKWYEYLSFIVDTLVASIEYPDSNNFYPSRQLATVPFVLTEEQGRNMMRKLAEYISLGREKKIGFMFGRENCAYMPQNILSDKSVLGDKVPNLYRVHFLKTEASNPYLNKLFRFVKWWPKEQQPGWITVILTILGYHRGIDVNNDGVVNKTSLKNSLFSTSNNPEVKHHMYNPSYARIRIQKGEIHGVLSGGHGND